MHVWDFDIKCLPLFSHRGTSSARRFYWCCRQEIELCVMKSICDLNVDNGGRCDLRVSFVLSMLRFFSRTFASAIDKESLSRLA